MNSCGTVSMDRYWSYVATPLFYTVIGFGVYTLFVTQDIQVVSKSDIKGVVGLIRDARDEMNDKDKGRPNPIAVTNPPPTPKQDHKKVPPPKGPPPNSIRQPQRLYPAPVKP